MNDYNIKCIGDGLNDLVGSIMEKLQINFEINFIPNKYWSIRIIFYAGGPLDVFEVRDHKEDVFWNEKWSLRILRKTLKSKLFF